MCKDWEQWLRINRRRSQRAIAASLKLFRTPRRWEFEVRLRVGLEKNVWGGPGWDSGKILRKGPTN